MLRRDSDEDSPRDEIEYWKTRSTRLNLLQQQLASEDVADVIQCLQLNRSKLLRRWTEALRKLTNSCHESNNNSLYLNDFEHHCRMLYVWNPVSISSVTFYGAGKLRYCDPLKKITRKPNRCTSLSIEPKFRCYLSRFVLFNIVTVFYGRYDDLD